MDIIPGPEKITIREHQIEHINIMNNVLQRSLYFVDTSDTGRGKTVTTIYMSLYFQMPLLVFGPANIKNNWKCECEKYGAQATFISYQTLARGNTAYVKKVGDTMVPTHYLRDTIASRVMVVYDEAQDIKSKTSMSMQACHVISQEITKANNGSRIIILSATLFDKEEHSESALKYMGIINSKELLFYNVGTGEYVLKGYGYMEAIEYCKSINPKMVEDCKANYINIKNVRNSLFKMIAKIVAPSFSHSMPRPPIIATFHPRIGYFNMEEKYMERLSDAIKQLQKIVRFDESYGIVDKSKVNWKAIQSALKAIEFAKLPLFVRLIKDKLYEDRKCKVVAFFWSRKSIHYMMEAFKLFKPIQLNGQITVDQRNTKLVPLFMRHDSEYRVVFAHPKAAGIGLSLDDTCGEYPRHTYMSSNFAFIPIHQCAGRTYRATTKSDSHFTIVYGKEHIEHAILNALSRKTEVVKELSNNADAIYPADYPEYIEG